uniref:Uncharacterized protein n=1 Tax=Arundo donax TaxID=35708 RepID=A0A0A9ELK3_ARUDO
MKIASSWEELLPVDLQVEQLIDVGEFGGGAATRQGGGGRRRG